jgi:transposase
VIPRQWKVIQIVREKFTCRACEKIAQPPAPFHPIARGRAGAGLLAMVSTASTAITSRSTGRVRASPAKDLDVSTLADWVGASAAALSPLVELIRRHVLNAQRIHGDDTTVPVLAKGKTVTGRLWTYIRDDRLFGGPDPPAAVYAYSGNRDGAHPRRHLADYGGILQADAFAGFNALYEPSRKPGPITEAACWSHARRKFFVLADVAEAPLALEAVRRIDAIFDVERTLNGLPVEQRLALHKQHLAPLVGELEAWMRCERARLSRLHPLPRRWPHLPEQQRRREGAPWHCPRQAQLGSDRGGERAAAIYTLIATAKLNDVDPEAWLADTLPPHQRPAGIAAGRASAGELEAPVCQVGGMSGTEIPVAGVGFEALDVFLSSNDAPPERACSFPIWTAFSLGSRSGRNSSCRANGCRWSGAASSRSSPMAIRRRPSSAPS